MSKNLQSAWIKAAKLHIAENPNIYGRGAVAPSDDTYINFLDKKIVERLNKVGLSLSSKNYKEPLMIKFINTVLDNAIKDEEGGDAPMPISKNARLKLARSLKESLNQGFEI